MRRTAVAIALVLLLLVPSIALMAATGQPAASYSALGTLVGAVAVLAGGVRIGVLTSIVLSLLAPWPSCRASPITGAALMALMTLVVGRMSLFGLHRAVMLVPIMLAWPMLAPVPWVPREALDKINELMSKRGMTLAQTIDASQHSGTSGSSSAAGPLKNAVSQALMEQRYDTTYLTWVVVFFFIGAIIPVILLPFVARKANMRRPDPTTHTRAEAMAYTVTISGLTAVATYYFLNHPKMTAGSFLHRDNPRADPGRQRHSMAAHHRTRHRHPARRCPDGRPTQGRRRNDLCGVAWFPGAAGALGDRDRLRRPCDHREVQLETVGLLHPSSCRRRPV